MDAAAEAAISRVFHAAQTASTPILQFVARNVAGSGPVVLQGTLFKAGKPPTKYANFSTDAASGGAQVTEFKAVVVTARHTLKIIAKVTAPPPPLSASSATAAAKPATAGAAASGEEESAEQRLRVMDSAPVPPAPRVELRCEWANPLSAIVGVYALFDSAKVSAPSAVFAVVFLCAAKDAKREAAVTSANKDDPAAKPGAADEDVASAMTRKRTAIDWTLLALRGASEVTPSASETARLTALFQTASRPSLRCRAYLVPDVLGGVAQRDEWVQVYRAALQNYWQERLESSIMPAPEVFQWCGWAQLAPPGDRGATTDAAPPLPSSAFCVVALSTKRLYVIAAADGQVLANENARIPASAARAVDVAALTSVALPAPWLVALDVSQRAFARLHFLCAQHASEFILETQRVFDLVAGDNAAFPIVVPALPGDAAKAP